MENSSKNIQENIKILQWERTEKGKYYVIDFYVNTHFSAPPPPSFLLLHFLKEENRKIG